MRGQRRPSRPRSIPAMTRPASAPQTTVRRRGRTAANTTPQPREIAPWATTPVAARAPGGASSATTSVPAAWTASNGERPVANACTVDGTPLSAAATAPARRPTRSSDVPIDDNDADHDSRGAAVPVLLPDQPLTSLDEYIDGFDGGQGLVQARELGSARIVETIERSGLRGRGGAGFPTGRKWASILAGGPEVGDRYAVGNGAEGEPGTFKDRMLMRRNPYQVVEGLAISAATVDAVGVYLAVKASFEPEIEALSRALREMSEAGLVGDVPITLVTGPEEYLFGEEKALLEVIE